MMTIRTITTKKRDAIEAMRSLVRERGTYLSRNASDTLRASLAAGDCPWRVWQDDLENSCRVLAEICSKWPDHCADIAEMVLAASTGDNLGAYQ